MKVLVVNNMAPFLWGGAEELAVHLQRNLEIAGHDSEILRIPFQWEPAVGIPEQMMLVRNLELRNVDRVIALKFPAYTIRHEHKSLWLLHQYRQAYDLYDAGETNIPVTPEGDRIRSIIKNSDDECFSGARRIFTNSAVTRDRLMKYNGVQATVLQPPVNDPQNFPGGEPGGYVFAGGRINDLKRQNLLVEALAQTSSRVKLVIAGPPESNRDIEKIHRLAEQGRVQDRLLLDFRLLPREVYADYVNKASAVAYLPFDEDSMGYVAMEGATAGKPLITTRDSGGVADVAINGATGWLCEPSAGSLAQALEAVYDKPLRTRAYGMAARELWQSMKVNWPETVERLLA